jgi:heat shock protein HslJ
MLSAVLPALLLVSVAACAPSQSSLAGTSWLLEQESEFATASGLGLTSVTLEFGEDGSVSGAHAYLGYAGSYAQDGDGLTITDLCWTGMMCQAEIGLAAQQSYLDALSTARSYAIEGDRLTIITADDELVFQRRDRQAQ